MTTVEASSYFKSNSRSYSTIASGDYFLLDTDGGDIYIKVTSSAAVVIRSGIAGRTGMLITSFTKDTPVTLINRVEINYTL
jgi:hypothetical protein